MADAVRSYERALAGFPTNTGVIGALAGYLERIGQTDRAAPILDPFGDGTAFGAPFGLMNYHLARGRSQSRRLGSRSHPERNRLQASSGTRPTSSTRAV
jgi:hypothetical protein